MKKPQNSRKPKFSEFLSDVSVEVVIALTTRDARIIKELGDHLTQYEANAKAENEPELAAYFSVLRGLLQGEDVSTEAENLVEPYRWGYNRILQELENETKEDVAGLQHSEWLVNLTSLVAYTVKHGTDEDRVKLEQELAGLARKVRPEEVEFHDFMAALRSVLRGEDTRKLAIQLQPPYRQAFLSLLQVLATSDATDFVLRSILDRIEHNTITALTQGNDRLRLAVAEALADIEEMLPEDDPATRHLRPLIISALALLLNRKPHRAVKKLPEPYATTWRNILAASKKKK
jgi:hypothetical protein